MPLDLIPTAVAPVAEEAHVILARLGLAHVFDRDGTLAADGRALVHHAVRRVLHGYTCACAPTPRPETAP